MLTKYLQGSGHYVSVVPVESGGHTEMQLTKAKANQYYITIVACLKFKFIIMQFLGI